MMIKVQMRVDMHFIFMPVAMDMHEIVILKQLGII